ncbi:SAF domain-containing protein [Nocardioides sambongensis]|uniref:SAF domain-containing protein n=1 Tax=Nocardioides sambongensis TaxID=2589074 RepID=UPI00112DE040|nr:SAF domain-containing protein [Nocardioides sambongensis]
MPRTDPAPPRRRAGDLLRSVRRRVLRRRRLLAAAATAVAVAAGLSAVAPTAPATSTVVVASRDLPAGALLGAGDLTVRELPDGAVPDGTLTAPAGAVLAGSVRRGEPITDARVVGAGLLPDGDERVVVPLRLSDSEQAALLGAGDLIDLVATDPSSATTRVVAESVTVLAVPTPQGGGATGATGSLGGRLVIVAAPVTAADAVAASGVSSFVTFRWVRR